ncbi:MAG: DnaB-like helicase C-terminal domain-containing protein [Bacteroidota bacterium]
MLEEFSDIEFEEQLIGTLLNNPQSITEANIAAEDFYDSLNAEFFMRIVDGFKNGEYITEIKLISQYPEYREHIQRLCRNNINTQNARGYAEEIYRLALLRRISQLSSDVKKNSNPHDIISYIMSMDGDSKRKCSYSWNELTDLVFDDLESDLDFYPTGFRLLDKIMGGGLYEGYVYGIAGKEKSGKTTLAHTISYNLECNHLYVAMEMGAKQIHQRNIARSINRNSLDFLHEAERKKIIPEKSKVEQRNAYLMDAAGWSWADIKREIIRHKIRYGIKGFIVDYWQLIQESEKGETEEYSMRKSAQAIADFCRNSGLWCICLAQMNKQGDLFGGGGLRKACDQLYFIKQPDENAPKEQQNQRWLRMGASRYTPLFDAGREGVHPFFIDNIGPKISEHEAETEQILREIKI